MSTYGNNQGDGARRGRDLVLYANANNAAAATILSRTTNFHTLVNTELVIYVDEDDTGTAIRVKFLTDDFADPASPTVAEIVTKLNDDTAFSAAATASAAADGRLQIVSDTTAGVSQLYIGNGTANPVFGWPQDFDIDCDADAIVVPAYTEEEAPANVTMHTYDPATEAYTRIAPSTSEVYDKDAETLTLPHAADAIHAYRVSF